MSSNSFAGTVELRLRPSVRALQVVFVLHILAVGLVPFAMAPGKPMLALLLAFAGSWLWLRRHPVFGFGLRAIDRVVWHADGAWSVRIGGELRDATLQDSSYVHPRLLVLNFKLADGSRRSRALLGDEADPSLLRQVRARLAATPAES